MDTLKNAANAAASYVGYDQTDQRVAGDQLGDLVHERGGAASTQSGVEPVSGRLGSGTAGQPYDSGNNQAGYGGNSTTGVAAGHKSTLGHGNTTSHDNTTSHGIYGESAQQENPSSLTGVASKLGSAFGLDPAHQASSGSESARTDSNLAVDGIYGQGGSYEDDGKNRGFTGGNNRSHLPGHGLGSDRSAGKAGDRYLFDRGSAPGLGGRLSANVDDFTDANIHHEGSGHSIISDLGSDASSGKAGPATGLSGITSGAGVGSGLGSETSKGTERSRKPGFGRQPSGLGYSTHGLNSGKPREGLGQKTERKAEKVATPAGVAGAGAASYGSSQSDREPLSGSSGSGVAGESYGPGSTYDGNGYGASQSGREPLSGVRGSGVAGEPYDQGNTYDGTSARGTGIIGQPDGERLGQTGEVSHATSGLNNLNLNKENSGLGAYSSNQTDAHGPDSAYDSQYRGADVPISGAAGVASSSQGASGTANYGATAPRDASDSTFGVGGLKERVAGAPNPSTSAKDCEEGHHNSHPHGVGAHQDGTHKPTFLNYQHDTFGVPVAKGD